jgi:electron transfer flavoprotein beta subunit
VETASVKHSMNPFDEIALEEAIRLREKNPKTEVTAVSIGPKACQDTLRTALAMGADKAIHVHCETEGIAPLQPLDVAKVLRGVVDRDKPELVILGKQAIDDDAGQVGGMLAGMLGWPQASFASKVELSADFQQATVTREVDGGLEVVEVKLPCIITSDLR